MENEKNQPIFSVGDFIALTNQTLEYAYPRVAIEGEVASFKVNQGKYVFFDLKDSQGSIGCFMMAYQLRMPIEDGMKIVVIATPKLTQWGKFSLTVQAMKISGEGNLKKSFELLKAKLDKEGLFADERKRPLPHMPKRIGVISSTQAAGYADFIKILNDRWGGVEVEVAHVQVQGADAPDQMIRALTYFNQQEMPPDVLVIVRGGGSADDLSAFSDELLVRQVASSRVPTLVGVGHEVDESLVDLAADVSAATPSNAAQLLVPDRNDIIHRMRQVQLMGAVRAVELHEKNTRNHIRQAMQYALDRSEQEVAGVQRSVAEKQRYIATFDPVHVLERGYALLRGDVELGGTIEIETQKAIIKAEVTNYDEKYYDEK